MELATLDAKELLKALRCFQCGVFSPNYNERNSRSFDIITLSFQKGFLKLMRRVSRSYDYGYLTKNIDVENDIDYIRRVSRSYDYGYLTKNIDVENDIDYIQEICVSLISLIKTVKELKGLVKLSLKNDKLIIKNNGITVRLQPNAKVVDLADISLERIDSITPHYLSKLLNIHILTSTDESRGVLNCVRIERDPFNFRGVATDGKILGIATIPDCGPFSPEPYHFHLNRKIVLTLGKLLKTLKTEQPIEIYRSSCERVISFSGDDFNLSIKLDDQQYPNYKMVIPTGLKISSIVDRKNILNSFIIHKNIDKKGILLELSRNNNSIYLNSTSGRVEFSNKIDAKVFESKEIILATKKNYLSLFCDDSIELLLQGKYESMIFRDGMLDIIVMPQRDFDHD